MFQHVCYNVEVRYLKQAAESISALAQSTRIKDGYIRLEWIKRNLRVHARYHTHARSGKRG